jgi:hypothetical protein
MRSRREHEVNYSSVDYTSMATSMNQFQHPDELFSFIRGLRVRLNEENLISVVDGLLLYADALTEEDTARPEF